MNLVQATSFFLLQASFFRENIEINWVFIPLMAGFFLVFFCGSRSSINNSY